MNETFQENPEVLQFNLPIDTIILLKHTTDGFPTFLKTFHNDVQFEI